MTVEVFGDAETLAAGIAMRLSRAVSAIQASGRRPRILLTGGTIASAAYKQVDRGSADWSDVEFWFGDERFLPPEHEDRNDIQAFDAFLDRVGADGTLVHCVPDDDGTLTTAQAAARYAGDLPEESFDVALFGVGPDGHVASLFPAFPQLDDADVDAVAVHDSPKPPPQRVTLTFPRLNRSSAVWFLVSGEDKARAVARALAPTGDVHVTPARGVHGIDETLWLLDRAAASRLDEG